MKSRHYEIKRAAASRFRPHLEPLEDRSLPSVVLTTEDNGDNSAPTLGSLRAAIIAANATRAFDEIDFAIKPADPGHVYYRNDGVAGQVSLDHVATTIIAADADIADIDPDWPKSWWSIRPPTKLPEIKWPLTIDGYSQPEARGNSLPQGSNAILRIELDGDGAGASNGLVIRAADCTMKGLVINRFGANGISLVRNGRNTVVEGNIIGLDASGSESVGNALAGVRTTNAGGLIGGTTPISRNVISGNQSGVLLSNSGLYFPTFVVGNLIGTDITGTKDRGNTEDGVNVGSAPGTEVGLHTQGAGNVISGNRTGVFINGISRRGIPGFGGGANCLVRGNIIGLDASGKARLGNTTGILVKSSFTEIGGATTKTGSGAGNVISGNIENGISVVYLRVGPPVEGTLDMGNIIGLDADGIEPIGNGLAGFRTTDAGARVGGLTLEARNVISANQNGVRLSNSGTDYHPMIQGNYIGTDISGNLDLGNTETGVTVGSAPGTRVGGTAPGAGNVISGNRIGVYINSISHTVIDGRYNCKVQVNLIGLTASGMQQPVGNGTGVLITNGYNLIGGAKPTERNIISGNQGHGIQIFQPDPRYPAIRNRVINNYIGTDPTGTRRFGNGLDGVLLGDATASNLLRDNLILFNARDGISLENADNNDVLSNTSNLNGCDGLRADAQSKENFIMEYTMLANVGLDGTDDSVAAGTPTGTANHWVSNLGVTSDPPGLF